LMLRLINLRIGEKVLSNTVFKSASTMPSNTSEPATEMASFGMS